MTMPPERIVLLWIAGTNLAAFVLFGVDKLRARRAGRRVPETHLFLISAIGGWPGGLLGMLVFRHKTAKTTFILKFAAAFVVWAGALAWLALQR